MFLNDEAKAALEQKLQGMQEETQPVLETKVSTRADETQVQSQTDVKNVEASSTDDKEESGHAVPYQRFKEVNETKKQLKAKTAQLERELEDMRAQLHRKSENVETKPQKERDIFDEIKSFYESDDVPDEKYSVLEQRLAAFEVKTAQAELEVEIANITKKYPEVPEAILLQACIQNPDQDLVQVARDYTQFIAEIEERALAKHAKRTPSAPPRPQSSGSSSVATGNGRPRNMAEARAAALAFMKQQGL